MLMYVTYSIFFVVLWREMMRRRRSDGAAVGVVVHWSPPSIHSSIHSKLTRNPNWNHNVSGNLHIHSTHCGISDTRIPCIPSNLVSSLLVLPQRPRIRICSQRTRLRPAIAAAAATAATRAHHSLRGMLGFQG